MNRYAFAASTLSAALGLALALPAPVRAADSPPQANMARAQKEHLEKCYGINAVAKNDCAAGAHSCAGQSTKDGDKSSFIAVPAGLCARLEGGSTSAK